MFAIVCAHTQHLDVIRHFFPFDHHDLHNILQLMNQIYLMDPLCVACSEGYIKRVHAQHIVEVIILFLLTAQSASVSFSSDEFTTMDILERATSSRHALLHKCPSQGDVLFHNMQDMLSHIHHHHKTLYQAWAHFNTGQNFVQHHKHQSHIDPSRLTNGEKHVHLSEHLMILM